MIVCGWCRSETAPGSCSRCGRDPALPWLQRAAEPPVIDERARRRRLLAEASKAIEERGERVTVDRLAEQMDMSARNVRRWQADVRSVA